MIIITEVAAFSGGGDDDGDAAVGSESESACVAATTTGSCRASSASASAIGFAQEIAGREFGTEVCTFSVFKMFKVSLFCFILILLGLDYFCCYYRVLIWIPQDLWFFILEI